MKRHNCDRTGTGRRGWMTCTVCKGRIHQSGCTSVRNPDNDCCPQRHEKLHKAGFTKGLVDSGVPMLPY